MSRGGRGRRARCGLTVLIVWIVGMLEGEGVDFIDLGDDSMLLWLAGDDPSRCTYVLVYVYALPPTL
jgi:hypothetical protein